MVCEEASCLTVEMGDHALGVDVVFGARLFRLEKQLQVGSEVGDTQRRLHHRPIPAPSDRLVASVHPLLGSSRSHREVEAPGGVG